MKGTLGSFEHCQQLKLVTFTDVDGKARLVGEVRCIKGPELPLLALWVPRGFDTLDEVAHGIPQRNARARKAIECDSRKQPMSMRHA